MDKLKKQRSPYRTAVSKILKEADAELKKPQLNATQLRFLLVKLENKMSELREVDQRILDALLEIADLPEADYAKEHEEIDKYVDAVLSMKVRINVALTPLVVVPTAGSTRSDDSNGGGGESGIRKSYKLPKIQVKRFNGEVKEWLSFWSQFQKIHEDVDLHATDKFQYLLQSVNVGTRARKVVESYPQTEDNYPKAVSALKSRFGDPVLLTEVYVRELLKLIINNASAGRNQSIITMYDDLESHLRSLESLGVNTEQNAVFIYPMVESSLPVEVLEQWQRCASSGYGEEEEISVSDRFKALMKFLRREVKGAERLSFVKDGFDDPHKYKSRSTPRKRGGNKEEDDVATASALVASEQSSQCVFCSKSHDSRDCGQAHSMSLHDKNSVLRRKRCCFTCLRIGHSSAACKSFIKCVICEKRHTSIMCPDRPAHKRESTGRKPWNSPGGKKEDSAKPVGSSSQSEEKIPTVTTAALSCSSKVLLKTLQVKARSKVGRRKIRMLIDDGSQRSYVLTKVAQKLELPEVGEDVIIHSLFGGHHTAAKTHKKYKIFLEYGSNLIEVEVLGQDTICGRIPRMNHGRWMAELKNKKIWLSDIGEDAPEIEVLIGADVIGTLLTGNIQQLSNGLTAIETRLGWTIMGKAKEEHEETVGMLVTSMHVSDASTAELWRLETIGIRDPGEIKSQEEREEMVRVHFQNTVRRLQDGRYSVSLPWTDGRQAIPSNKVIAEKRLDTATKKLKEDGMFDNYDEIFKSWLSEGIIEEVKEDALVGTTKASHYLPHRPVIKLDSETTPVRPVFDASCKTKRTPSLNECLEKGPNLQDLIPSILLRFREGKIGVISDIRKAFLMIEIEEDDRDYLRFLWWENPDCKTHRIFRHRRVVFGVNCSPFLLGAVIDLHLRSMDKDHQHNALKLLRSMYVDICVSSVNSLVEYDEFQDQCTKMMAEAKMDLRLWQRSSVEDSRVSSLSNRECGLESGGSAVQKQPNSTTSVLGLNWDTREDYVNCVIYVEPVNNPVTKRKILAQMQKIFDPLGFLCPVLLEPKLIVQEAWCLKSGWDEPLPETMQRRFLKLFEEIPWLKKLKIPRNFNDGEVCRASWQLHCFVDASKEAYAAVVFLRATGERGVSVQLLQAKTRVAPLKSLTIPRLELMACCIGARLVESVVKSLNMEEIPKYFWSDSSTALSWIKRNDEWGTFVGNRVREILYFSNPDSWHHVPGISNPADLPSRGCSPAELLESRWWEGPSWLKKTREEWPVKTLMADEDLVAAEKKKGAVTMMISTKAQSPWYAKKSSFYQNVRIVAWCRRLIGFLIHHKSLKGLLSVNEIIAAEKAIIRMVQEESFPKDTEVISGIRVQRRISLLLNVLSLEF